MPGETGARGISDAEIAKATKRNLKSLHKSQMRSFDIRVGNQPTERELAEKAMRIVTDMTKLPDNEEGDKQERWAQNYLNELGKSSAGLTLMDGISKKLIAEQKEKEKSYPNSQ